MLDLLHKGIFPGIGIVIAGLGIGIALHADLSNSDKRRQLDKLEAEFITERQQRLTAEKMRDSRDKDARMAEERAHNMRVALLKQHKIPFNVSNDPREEKAACWIKAGYGFVLAAMNRNDQKLLGEGKAKELWDRATAQAEEEVKAGKINWEDL
jgi:hypothetical protein